MCSISSPPPLELQNGCAGSWPVNGLALSEFFTQQGLTAAEQMKLDSLGLANICMKSPKDAWVGA